MGKIKKILYTAELEKNTCELYNDKMSCETAENLHLHWKNVRIEFGKEAWQNFCVGIGEADMHWHALGRPEFDKNIPTIYLPSPRDIEPVSEFFSTRYQIELQDNQFDSIHIHLRELRLEFSIPEFMEFAEGIIKAKEALENGR